MDFSKLSMGMKLVLVGGALALVALVMPWYRFAFINASALNSGLLAWGGCLLAIGAAAILLLKSMGKNEVKGGGFGTEQIAFFAAAAAVVLIAIRYFTFPSASGLGSIGVGVGMGLWLGLIGAGLTAYGAFSVMKDAGMDFKPQQPQQPQQG